MEAQFLRPSENVGVGGGSLLMRTGAAIAVLYVAHRCCEASLL